MRSFHAITSKPASGVLTNLVVRHTSMRTLLTITLALALLPAASRAQTCNCTEQFDWLGRKLALNYAGYRDKVTAEKQPEFDRHTAAWREKTALATADTSCARLMTEWMDWFRDGHLYLMYGSTRPASDTAAIRARYVAWERISLTEADARAYLDRPGRDSLEGIYQARGGNYRLALIRNTTPERDFVAVTLKADSVWWMPGQVKFDLKDAGPGRYTARYYMLDHSERNPEVEFAGGKLTFKGLNSWYRQYPGAPVHPDVWRPFELRQLDSATLLLRVTTMNVAYRESLDSLIRANRKLLERTPNLIIDCRGNGGGSDVTFNPLRPYVYTGTARSLTTKIYATKDNIEKYEQLRVDKNYPRKQRKRFGRLAKKLKRREGEFYGFCEIVKSRPERISPYPLKVAVLIDGRCASSCEQFVYYARQSERVTLIGQNTAGIMDYGNLHFLTFPCGNKRIWYPTSRSCRVDAGQAIDGTGIPPAVRIDDEKADWVEIAREYLKRER